MSHLSLSTYTGCRTCTEASPGQLLQTPLSAHATRWPQWGFVCRKLCFPASDRKGHSKYPSIILILAEWWGRRRKGSHCRSQDGSMNPPEGSLRSTWPWVSNHSGWSSPTSLSPWRCLQSSALCSSNGSNETLIMGFPVSRLYCRMNYPSFCYLLRDDLLLCQGERGSALIMHICRVE